MSPSCRRGRAALWLVAALCTVIVLAPARAAEPVLVQLDQARVIKLPERATTVVIGNPLIADVSIEPNGVGVITGKGYGGTNVIVLDREGAVLAEHKVLVQEPSDPVVFVYRGSTRQTYSCTPDCDRRVTLGDTGTEYFDGAVDKDYFARNIGQTTTRDNQAMAAGAKQ